MAGSPWTCSSERGPHAGVATILEPHADVDHLRVESRQLGEELGEGPLDEPEVVLAGPALEADAVHEGVAGFGVHVTLLQRVGEMRLLLCIVRNKVALQRNPQG